MASEEITKETAEQPVEAATPAPVAETPAAAVSAPEEIKKPEPRKDIFAELGLGGDDDKPKILKAKGSKNVSTGVVHAGQVAWFIHIAAAGIGRSQRDELQGDN